MCRSSDWRVSVFALVLPLTAAACDDPAPIVLGRLHVATDAGSGDAAPDAEEPGHEPREHEQDHDDEAREPMAGAGRD